MTTSLSTPRTRRRGQSSKPQNKTAAMLAALSRRHGARLSDLEALTGWQTRSIHAALTGFRHQGYAIVREINARGEARYRLETER
jgi:hypothetical protein